MTNQSFDAVIKYSDAAIRGAFLLNGGACLALLTFIGNLKTTPGTQAFDYNLSSSLLFFAYGSLAAVLTSAISYISQSCDNEGHLKTFLLFRLLAVAVYIISLLLFLLGINVVHINLSSSGI
jgi:hypothetical protein